MKKTNRSKQATTVPTATPSLQPGAQMRRLLSEVELKQVAGGRSGPSRRGAGH
jgi:hypothetical protein